MDLVLREETDGQVDAKAAGRALAEALLSRVGEIFAEDEAGRTTLRARVEFLCGSGCRSRRGRFLTRDQLSKVLEEACVGKRSVEELSRGDWREHLQVFLPYPLDRLWISDAAAYGTSSQRKECYVAV